MSASQRISGGAVAASSIPDSTRKLCSLERIDYADTFSLALIEDHPKASPEQWIRAMFGDTPNSSQTFIWRGLLRLPLLQERSPTSVAGWRIGRQSDSGIQLENESWLLRGNLIVEKTSAGVSLTTLIQNKSILSGMWWTILSAVHRTIVPSVLLGAEEKIKKIK